MKNNIVFLTRTLRVLDQYEEIKQNLDQSYSRTLFINACVGLLMVPTEAIYESLPADIVNIKDWGIAPDDIITIKKNDKTVRNVAKMLRHSIAHNNFYFDCGDDNISIPIMEIYFKNWYGELDMHISYEQFKKFVLNVSRKALELMQKIDKEEKE